MATINKDYGEGAISDRSSESTNPPLAEVLRDIADDLGAAGGTVAEAGTVPDDLGAFTAPPSAPEMAALRTAVNYLLAEARLRATAGAAIKTVKG